MKRAENKEYKKYGFLNVIIIILTVILFFMIIGLISSTSPRTNTYYEERTSEDIIRSMQYSGYQRMLEYKLENDALGVTADKNPTLTVPNAMSDYYEAAFCYRGYKAAGPPDKAAGYRAVMDDARGRMGEYTYVADEIDEYLGLD